MLEMSEKPTKSVSNRSLSIEPLVQANVRKDPDSISPGESIEGRETEMERQNLAGGQPGSFPISGLDAAFGAVGPPVTGNRDQTWRDEGHKSAGLGT